MHEYDGLPPVEFLEDRVVSGMPQPLVVVAGHEPNPIRLEGAKRVLDLTQAAFGVRKRYYGKATESARVTSGQLGRVFVHTARCPRRRLWVAEPDTGESEGENGHSHAVFVHRGNRLFRRPTQPCGMNPPAARCCDPIAIFSAVKRWDEVMMHIDQTTFREERRLRKDRREASNT